MKILIAYSDPSHGWVKVKRKELEKLGIDNLISSCSYERKDYVYLEEDCDLTIYINKLKENNIAYKFKENWTNRRSKIRTYNTYQQRG